MLINQSLTKEEINNLLFKLKGYFKRLSPPTNIVLVGMAIGNLFFLILNFRNHLKKYVKNNPIEKINSEKSKSFYTK